MELAKHIETHHADLAQRLAAVRGIGPATVATLIADVPELGRLFRREVSALIGVAPFNRYSGQLRGKRAIFGVRGQMRCGVYICHAASRASRGRQSSHHEWPGQRQGPRHRHLQRRRRSVRPSRENLLGPVPAGHH
ncbi:hypothetical protein EWI61_11690 [Methylolobus aquaticus]|nr:hypothetical protein EWI61_11690 [Methylolobus aquaticus]